LNNVDYQTVVVTIDFHCMGNKYLFSCFTKHKGT